MIDSKGLPPGRTLGKLGASGNGTRARHQRMKIGIDCRLHYYNRTGIGRYIRNLIREFPESATANMELVLLQSRREREALYERPRFTAAGSQPPPIIPGNGGSWLRKLHRRG